jgi:hypothetical protein
MSVTGQRKQRIRSHDPTEVGVARVGDIGAELEQLANMAGIAEDDHVPEDRQIDREGRPVSAAQELQRDSAIRQRRHTLKDAGHRGTGGHLQCRRRRLVINRGHHASQLGPIVAMARRR